MDGAPDQGARADEAELVRELVETHSGAVFRMAKSIVQDAALAEDVVQETFIRAWRNADSYSGAVPIRNWLLRIAHNVAVSTLRTIRDEATDPATLPVAVQTRDGPDVVVEARSLIEAALASLDPLSRSIVVLREVEQLTYDEIADILDLPLPTVKTRLFRARSRLRSRAEEAR